MTDMRIRADVPKPLHAAVIVESRRTFNALKGVPTCSIKTCTPSKSQHNQPRGIGSIKMKYTCMLGCGYSCQQKSTMRSHLQRKDPCFKPHGDEAEGALAQQEALQQLHAPKPESTGRRVCPDCGKSLASRQSLHVHRRNSCKQRTMTVRETQQLQAQERARWEKRA